MYTSNSTDNTVHHYYTKYTHHDDICVASLQKGPHVAKIKN